MSWRGYGYSGAELYHHGIKGQKWGVRRYQNEDGSLTEEGKEHYGRQQAKIDRYKESTGAGKVSILAERASKPVIGGFGAYGLITGAIGASNALNILSASPIIASLGQAGVAGAMAGALATVPVAGIAAMVGPAVVLGGTRIVGRLLENTNRLPNNKMEKSDKAYYEKYKDRYTGA